MESLTGVWEFIPIGIKIATGLIGIAGTVWAVAHTLGVRNGRIDTKVRTLKNDVDNLHEKVREIGANQVVCSRELSSAIRGQAEEINGMNRTIERHDIAFRDLRKEIIDMMKWVRNGGRDA